MTRQKTIGNLWQDAIAADHAGPAYLQEIDGEWQPVSWSEAATAVEELANGLLALGVAKGDAFALLGRTALEWALFDYALALVGAVGAPIYSSSSERDVRYVLDHSQAIGVLVEDDAQRAKVGDAVAQVITYAGLGELRGIRSRVRSRAPGCAARAGRLDRRGRPVHVHLHVRDNGAAEGLHDPPPQLLLDGAEERRVR